MGLVAGSTIFVGLPVGRLQGSSTALKATLSAAATGILLFLLYDVLQHGVTPADNALTSAVKHGGSWGEFVGYAALLAGGFGVGLLGLVHYDRWMSKQRAKSLLGPGAASAAEFEPSWIHGMSSASWLSLLIATGIGLHNFSEGLAIGQSAALGQTSLALVLIIGFALHNGTEGLGIVAPLAEERRGDAEALGDVVQPEADHQDEEEPVLVARRGLPDGQPLGEVVQPDPRGDHQSQLHRGGLACPGVLSGAPDDAAL